MAKDILDGRQVYATIGEIAFPEGSGYEHFATSWELSWSPDFEDTPNNKRNEDAIIVSNLIDTKNLTEWIYRVPNLTDEDVIFCRTKIHYRYIDQISGETKENESNWSPPVDILGNQENFKVSNVIIATPRLHLEEDYTGNQSGNLIITTEPMELFIGYGDHIATTWIIEDTNGKELVKVDKSEDMLTEFRYSMSNLEKNRIYVIKAIHHTSTNAKSLEGKYIYNDSVYKSDLYDLIVNGHLVVDRKLTFTVVLNVPKFISIDICLKDLNDNIKTMAEGQKTLFPEMLPEGIVANEPYDIYSRLEYEPGQYTNWKLIKRMRARGNEFGNVDRFAKYTNRFTFMHPIIQHSNKYLKSIELYQGGFILPRSTDDSDEFTGLGYYKIEGDNLLYVKDLVYTTDQRTNQDMLSNWGVDVMSLENGDVVVTTTRIIAPDEDKLLDPKSNLLVFNIYKVNESNNEFTLDRVIESSNHYGSTAISGSAVPVKNDVYFIPSEYRYGPNKVELKLFKFNYETSEIEEVSTLPFIAHKFVSMCKLDNTKLLILGGVNTDIEKDDVDYHRTNNSVYIYDTNTKTFDELITFDDTISTDIYNFHASLRKDGKVMLFNNTEMAGKCEDQSTIIIDINEKFFKKLDNDFDNDRPFMKTLECNNGNYLRISSSEYNPQMIYAYNIYGYTSVSHSGEIISGVITDLVVPEKTTITINNPYKYRSITIKGSVEDGTTGTLIWLDKDVIRKYHADTKFICSDEVHYDDTQESITNDPTIKQVVVLDTVTIHIKEGVLNDPDAPVIIENPYTCVVNEEYKRDGVYTIYKFKVFKNKNEITINEINSSPDAEACLMRKVCDLKNNNVYNISKKTAKFMNVVSQDAKHQPFANMPDNCMDEYKTYYLIEEVDKYISTLLENEHISFNGIIYRNKKPITKLDTVFVEQMLTTDKINFKETILIPKDPEPNSVYHFLVDSSTDIEVRLIWYKSINEVYELNLIKTGYGRYDLIKTDTDTLLEIVLNGEILRAQKYSMFNAISISVLDKIRIDNDNKSTPIPEDVDGDEVKEDIIIDTEVIE